MPAPGLPPLGCGGGRATAGPSVAAGGLGRGAVKRKTCCTAGKGQGRASLLRGRRGRGSPVLLMLGSGDGLPGLHVPMGFVRLHCG